MPQIMKETDRWKELSGANLQDPRRRERIAPLIWDYYTSNAATSHSCDWHCARNGGSSSINACNPLRMMYFIITKQNTLMQQLQFSDCSCNDCNFQVVSYERALF